ncbi:IS3 family transposase, partial [Burkholderia orbicola]|uniref:IS3 family transposase n=1 Tax=Burkholderia orbicola TaxID=2978683 RepID=UPI002FDF16D4
RLRRPHALENACCPQPLRGAVKRPHTIKRRIYPNRATAATDVFDYIEMFYNPIRRHGSAGDLSPVEFERRYALNGS